MSKVPTDSLRGDARDKGVKVTGVVWDKNEQASIAFVAEAAVRLTC
jgi:hypothetical protein